MVDINIAMLPDNEREVKITGYKLFCTGRTFTWLQKEQI
jgi:hypothetical protein